MGGIKSGMCERERTCRGSFGMRQEFFFRAMTEREEIFESDTTTAEGGKKCKRLFDGNVRGGGDGKIIVVVVVVEKEVEEVVGTWEGEVIISEEGLVVGVEVGYGMGTCDGGGVVIIVLFEAVSNGFFEGPLTEDVATAGRFFIFEDHGNLGSQLVESRPSEVVGRWQDFDHLSRR